MSPGKPAGIQVGTSGSKLLGIDPNENHTTEKVQ